MKNFSVWICCFICLAGGADIFAQQRVTFAEHPSRRQETVERTRDRASCEKDAARVWAKHRNLEMRQDDGHRVKELVAIREGRPIYFVTHNDNAAISTAANRVRDTAPFNVDGAGVTIGVWDGGAVRSDHQEFEGRVTIKDGAAVNYHATHVGGTIAAAGVDLQAQGMAPEALIYSYNWDQDESEMAAMAASYAGEWGKIMLSNHSYGQLAGWDGDTWFGDGWSGGTVEKVFGRYSSYSHDWDEILYDAPYFLPFVSAGNDRNDGPSEGETVYYNGSSYTYDSIFHPPGDGVYKDGYDTLSDKAVCKNAMTVGAVNDAVSGGNRSLAVSYTSFSSWGPTDDGRIKPDIVANGEWLYSCGNESTIHYISLSGTSMSSPNACGSAALLIEYYNHLFSGQSMMRASTLKGLIIHTADDLGRPGPDYSYGWGLMNTRVAAELLDDLSLHPNRLTEAKFSSSANLSDTYSIFSDGTEPVRVTLCWTDPEAVATTIHDDRRARLVNDLDLKVTGPGGTYYPYSLSYSEPTANATALAKNDVDNVEQVVISVPVAGLYTITVDFDGTLTGETQYYSLLVSGQGTDSDDDGMPDIWESTYFQSTTAAVSSQDTDNDGSSNYSEYVAGTIPTDVSSVFRVTGFCAPCADSPFSTVQWATMPGRLYSVGYSSSLHLDFTLIPEAIDLPHTQTNYIDLLERSGISHFYRVEVRLDR